MDPTPPSPVQGTKKPDPALSAREEALWAAVLADFENEERHNEYLGFLIRENLLVQGSRRYGQIAKDAAGQSVERRRIANLRQQRITKILFFVPDQPVRRDAMRQSKAELLAAFLGVVVGLALLGFGLVSDSMLFRVLGLLGGAATIGLIGLFVYRRVQQGAQRLRREW